MISIFYDLETTDLERVGQILNFAFIAVDSDFSVLDSITAKVKISRLQLPRVGAILTNRTNVLEHQNDATLTEQQAAQEIQAFIQKWIKNANGESVALIGYNSASFDLNFLRTVLIRNGVNPYHSSLVSKDLLLVARHLMATNDTFHSRIVQHFGENKVNLRLESLCRIHSLLDNEQAHESLSDVLLTASLAKKLLNEFAIDVRKFEPYQIKPLHEQQRGGVHTLVEPLSSHFGKDKRHRTYPATLLDFDERYALWVDLSKFKTAKAKKADVKSAVKWKKFIEHTVLCFNEPPDEEYVALATEALDALKDCRLKNYFGETNCDIEQFIYRISPSEISLLQGLLKNNGNQSSANNDVQQVLRRYWLENANDEDNSEFTAALTRYAHYRYGGKLLLKNFDASSEEDTTSQKSLRHPTLRALFSEIDRAEQSATDNDKPLIEALRKFYLDSSIYRVAGKELMNQNENVTSSPSSE